MPLYYILILALVQGISEFLPISSSGHLVLAHEAMDGNAADAWKQNLMLDVAVHVGTLFSVLVYFRKDVVKMIAGFKDILTGNCTSESAKLDLYVIAGSIPVILAGFAIHCYEPSWLRTLEVMAWMTLIFGIILWWVDETRPAARDLKDMRLKDAVLIGLSQALALIPGTSRSGITMTTARYLGFNRSESAHYSLLLAIVAISGAGALSSIDLIQAEDVSLTFDALLAAFLAFIAGWIAIALMMAWLQKSSFRPFAIYRICLGVLLLGLIYSGTLV